MIDRINEIIVKQLIIEEDAHTVVPEANFFDDLGADSLDIIELVMFVEDEFSIEIPDETGEKLRTVEDLYKCVDELTQPKLEREPEDYPCVCEDSKKKDKCIELLEEQCAELGEAINEMSKAWLKDISNKQKTNEMLEEDLGISKAAYEMDFNAYNYEAGELKSENAKKDKRIKELNECVEELKSNVEEINKIYHRDIEDLNNAWKRDNDELRKELNKKMRIAADMHREVKYENNRLQERDKKGKELVQQYMDLLDSKNIEINKLEENIVGLKASLDCTSKQVLDYIRKYQKSKEEIGRLRCLIDSTTGVARNCTRRYQQAEEALAMLRAMHRSYIDNITYGNNKKKLSKLMKAWDKAVDYVMENGPMLSLENENTIIYNTYVELRSCIDDVIKARHDGTGCTAFHKILDELEKKVKN